VFFVSLIVFPGALLSTNFGFLDIIEDEKLRGTWYNLIVILSFNVFDTIGRKIGGPY